MQRLIEVKQALNLPHSPVQLLQSQPIKPSLPISLKSSQPIPYQSVEFTQLNQQKPASPQSYSDKWLAAALLGVLVAMYYHFSQYTQRPLLLKPVITNSSPSPQLKTSQFPMKSQDQGVTPKVLSVSTSIGSLLLKVSLKNEGSTPRRFLYSFLNFTDDQGSHISAIIDGLREKVPANAKEFFDTMTIPGAFLKKSRKLSVGMTDYPTQELKLIISEIPILR